MIKMSQARTRRVHFALLAPCSAWAVFAACTSYTPVQDDGGVEAGPDVVTPPAPPPPGDSAVDAPPVATAQRLYVVGGFDSAGAHKESYSAAIAADGTLSSWRYESSTPKPIMFAGSFATTRGVFLVGGGDDNGPTADLVLGEVDPSGAIASWSTAGAIPGTVYSPAVVANGSEVLVVGGNGPNAAPTNDVFRAPMTDGMPGLFASFAKLPAFYTQVGAVRVGSTLFYVGGSDSGGNAVGEVESAGITSAGLDPWKQETNLPTPHRAHVVLLSGTHVYAIGGRPRDQAIALDDVHVADVSGGAIASWSVTTALPAPRMYACGVVANGFIYVIGGVDGYADASSGALASSKANVYRTRPRADGSLEPWVEQSAIPVLRAGVGCAAR